MISVFVKLRIILHCYYLIVLWCGISFSSKPLFRLGVMISSDGNVEKKFEARIESAVKMIGRISEAVLRRKELSKKTKLKVKNATMLPMLVWIYG